MPKRVQLSRKKGWRKPENTVVVSRPTMWGNPFDVKRCGSREQAVRAYRSALKLSQPALLEIAGGPPIFGLTLIAWRERVKRELPKLRGKDLACWCPLDQPCHADVLLKLANKDSPNG